MKDQWPYSAPWWPQNFFQKFIFSALYIGVGFTIYNFLGEILGVRILFFLYAVLFFACGSGFVVAANYEVEDPDAGSLWPHNTGWWPKNVIQLCAVIFIVGFATVTLSFISTYLFGWFSRPTLFLCAFGATFITMVWYLYEDATEPAPPPALDIRGSLYRALWNAAIQHNFNVPDQKTWDLMLDVGEELFEGVEINELMSDSPLYKDRGQIAYQAVYRSLFAFLKALPVLEDTPFHVYLSNSHLIHDMVVSFRDDEKLKTLYARTVADTFHENVIRVTAKLDSRKPVYPQDYKGSDMVEQFLRDTPLRKLLRIPIPYRLDLELRFEHTWVMANSGHGKTQTLQHLISYDLEEKACVIVIDSQQKLIDNIASLQLGDRLVLIDPTVAVPSVNLFKLGGADVNQTLEMYRFMFGSLLDSPMTDNQKTLFDNSALLLSHVPNATFMDFFKLMDGEDYSQYYPKLDTIGRRFFEKDFFTKGIDGYEGNRKQVIRRLNTLMRTYPFTQMFAQSESKIDFEREMNAGKVILINTSTKHLGREGSKLFGRFFLALIANATTQRQHQSKPLPVYCYLDEADQYAKDDPLVQDLLARARKNSVGLILAHRWLEEMGTTVKALESTASIIIAGGLRHSDLNYMSKVMECDPELLKGSKGNFAVYQRGKPVVSVNVPFFTLENMPHCSKAQYAAIKQQQAKDYGVPNAPPPPPDIPDTHDEP